MGDKMKRAAILAGLLALLLGAFGLSGVLVEPGAVQERARPGEFDTKRALSRLQRVLGDETPHPVDSAEADGVRSRLIAELRALGLQPTITDDITCNAARRARAISCARIRNVLAWVGPGAGKAVMMVSHYDSTPVGAGAADDGIGMAVMMEAAAQLKTRPLKRPVLLLFNEGEEAGLIGARAFLDRNPLADQVDSIVNLEARGVTGPAVMFETSRPNGAAIAAYGGSVRNPAANSMTVDFYEMLPNDTDVSVFKERPYTILNLAVVGNETRYHSPSDVLAALDPKSVRHMGEQALAATAQLANGDRAAVGERLYTDVLATFLISIPKAVGIALLGLLVLAFGWLAWSRRGGVGRGVAAIIVALLDAGLTVFLAQWLVSLFRAGEWWRAHPEVAAFAIAVSALAAGLGSLLIIARGVARDRLRTGFWLVFLLLGAALTFVAPGAAIFFLAPPLVAGTAMLARRFEQPAALVAAALLFLTWAPLLHLSEVLMDMDSAWTFAPVAALIAFPFLVEMMPLMRRVPRKAAIGAATAAAVLAWVAAALAPAYSADRKQAFGIEYVRDSAAGRSSWMVANDGAPLPRGFEAFRKGGKVPFSARPRWTAQAPQQPVEAPAIEKLAERGVREGRLLTLRLRSNGAESLLLRASSEARLGPLRAAGVARAFGPGAAKDSYLLRCLGRSCDGLTFELLVGSDAPVDATLVGSRRGLPAAAAALVAVRTTTAQPQYLPDATIAFTRVKL
jgi:hypothetical protein